MENVDFAMVLGRFEGRRGGEAARATRRGEARRRRSETRGAQQPKLMYKEKMAGKGERRMAEEVGTGVGGGGAEMSSNGFQMISSVDSLGGGVERGRRWEVGGRRWEVGGRR